MPQDIALNTARADQACVIQITDTHIAREPGAQFDGVDTARTLAAVIDAILELPQQPDLVLLTGDLVDIPSAAAYRKLGRLLRELPVPVACLPGNHDEPGLMRAEMDAAGVLTPGSIDLGGWRLVLLDDWIPDSSNGRLSAAELARLEAVLARRPALPTLVAVHHAPVSIGSPWMDGMGFDNGEELLDLLARHPQVKLLLFGHIHQEFSSRRGQLALLGAPSTCVQFMPGATEYRVDPRPPGFRELSLEPGGTFSSRVLRARE